MDDTQTHIYARTQLQDLLDKGWTIQALADALRIDRETLVRWRDQGVPMGRAWLLMLALQHEQFQADPNHTPAQTRAQKELQHLFDKGWTLQALADGLKIDRETLSRWYNGTVTKSRAGLLTLALQHPQFQVAPPKQRRYNRPDS